MVSGFDKPHVAWFFRRLNSPPRLAHHPICDCFDNHLIRVGGIAVCLGCFCLAIGLVSTTLLLTILYALSSVPPIWNSWWVAWPLAIALYLPTIAQPFFQAKAAKILFRT